MAKYKGELGIGEFAVGHVQVGPADAAGPDPEQELAGTGLGIGEVGRPKRRPRPVQQHRAHVPVVDYTPI